ncbi:hypothetical protein F5882DRAFT_472093 [Hyaloscypha sp. PMI_1271]|nr:hypothetical protein F5882DRAFT_472093 [Hyaloscypha sp. PMI_1271]
MSLSTLRSSPAPRTPRERVYGRAEQYFDITALGARSSGTQFLPCPITEEPTNNWSAEDEATGTKVEKRYQANIKHESQLYELQDNQVYRKEYHDTRRDEIIPARYALCYNDTFEILTTIHEKLMHTSPSTAFEHARRIWYGPSRDDHAWISARCAHCNKEKTQKNSKGVTPIQSHYPGERMVLDLMDFRIRGLKAKTADEAANELSKWLNDNGYISILACDNGGEFKGEVIEVCSIEVANRIFKKRLRAARADTGIQSWIQLLPLIVWVINTTATSALPKGNIPYEVWFGRKPPTDFQGHKETARRARAALGEEVESDENSEGGEDSLFVDEEAD